MASIDEIFQGMFESKTKQAADKQAAEINPALAMAQLVGQPGAFAAFYGNQRNQAMANYGGNITDKLSGGAYSRGERTTPDQLNNIGMQKISKLMNSGAANTPTGQADILKIARAIDPQAAMELATKFSEANRQRQSSTNLASSAEAAKEGAIGNEGALAELDALSARLRGGDVDPSTTNQTITDIYNRHGITEGFKQSAIASNTPATPLKATLVNYDTASGEILALPTREDGAVLYQRVWQAPEEFGGVRRSDTVDIAGYGGRPLDSAQERRTMAAQIEILAQQGIPLQAAQSFVESDEVNKTQAQLDAYVETYNKGAIDARNRMASIEAVRPMMDDIGLALGVLSDPAVDAFISTNGVGGWSGYLKDLPGTTAKMYQDLEDGITSGIVLNKLAELKAQSSTGATGFGAMNTKEFEAIENALGSFSPTASVEHKRRVLEKVQFHFRNVQRNSMGQPPFIKPADTAPGGMYEGAVQMDNTTGKLWLDVGTGTRVEVMEYK